MQLSRNSRRDPVQLGIRIQIDAVAMQKLWTWTEVARGEVSALGLVEEIRNVDSGAITALLVTDLFLVKQKCSMDETTMDAQAVAQLMTDLEAKGIDSRRLRLWAHSHAGMSVFWSATDDQCVENLANGEWLLSLVVNKKHDAQMRLDEFSPCHLYLTDVVFEIAYPLIDGLAEQCLTEFKAKVSEDLFSMNGHRTLSRDTRDHVQDLRAAHDRGALTLDELQEEMDWFYPEDLDREERPF
ncbi:MAG TPA: hypothetical protein VGL38_05980 [bacterium]|jgi:hypothetical protein